MLISVGILALIGCAEADQWCDVAGREFTVTVMDTDKWPCGEPVRDCTPKDADCAGETLELECADGSRVVLTPKTITLIRGECRDEHAITWVEHVKDSGGGQ
jgi:hypothetical protein